MKKVILVLLLFTTLYSFADFDENSDFFTPDFQFDESITEFEILNPDSAVPYDEALLPAALKDIRRFEIILFGALPITMIFSQIAVDTGYWIKNDFDSGYIPLVGSGTKTNDQQLYSVGVGLLMAFVIATADMIIYQKKQRLREAEKVLKQKLIDERIMDNEEFTPVIIEKDSSVSTDTNLSSEVIEIEIQ